MSGILNAFSGGSYGKPPGAPTIGTAVGGNALACVVFTAPSCTGIPPTITGYQAQCVATGTHSATGSSSPIQITGLTNGTAYTFIVRAQNATGYGSYSSASNSVTPAIPNASQSYTSPGTYTWVAPTGVTSVSVVAVGGGSSGRNGSCSSTPAYGNSTGGQLRYVNNIAVTPGNSYTVVVGAGGPQNGCGTKGGSSYFANTSTVYARGGVCKRFQGGACCVGVGTGGNGGSGRYSCGGGGGSAGGPGGSGAGGYSGDGGRGGVAPCYPYTGTGLTGAGGAGGGGSAGCRSSYYNAGAGGGGVGLFGQGCSGAGAGRFSGGAGGSGGNAGTMALYIPCPCFGPAAYTGGTGGTAGGGGGTGGPFVTGYAGAGGAGAVRIMWPGSTRSFPSTNAGTP